MSDLSISLRLLFAVIISLDMITESPIPFKYDLIMSLIEINDGNNFSIADFSFR